MSTRCASMNRPGRSTRTLRTCGNRAHAPIDVRQKRLGLSSARSYFSRASVGAIPHGATARRTGSRSRPIITSLYDTSTTTYGFTHTTPRAAARPWTS